jgi:phage terminase large subunit-like protein
MQSPLAFIRHLNDPETGWPFVLNAAETLFLRHAFKTGPDGRLLYPELLYSCPKKSGKTTFAALLLLYCTLNFGKFGEGYSLANDFEQAQGRVFAAAKRIIEASPALAKAATVTANRIEFSDPRATLSVIASDAAGAAGSNPCISTFDELWGYVSERSRRLWDEMIPPPTRKLACRLTTTYAGYEGESELLEELYTKGLRQPQIGPDLYAGDGLLMLWSHTPAAPWQSDAWLEQMRLQHRPNAYLRQIENRWVTSESSFVDLAWWDTCVDPQLTPVVADPELPVWAGADASVKRDSTAIVAVTWDDVAKKVRLVTHKVFQPSPDQPLDFENTIEATIRELRRRFLLRGVWFDPFQMQAVAQRLQRDGVRMVEFPQSVPNLTEASSNLYELIKGRNLVVYADDSVRLAVSRAIAVETTRGWRLTKEKTSHKIDVVVALAMAAHACVQRPVEEPMNFHPAIYFGTPRCIPGGGAEPRPLTDWSVPRTG